LSGIAPKGWAIAKNKGNYSYFLGTHCRRIGWPIGINWGGT